MILKSCLIQTCINKGEAKLEEAPPQKIDICALITKLESMVERERLLHSLGTCHTMLLLAERFGISRETAALAGLLHDCARSASQEERERILDEGDAPISAEDMAFPKIWHARLGATLARSEFGIADANIVEAIRIHPTGGADMSPLAIALFVADYIEPTRSFENVADFRKLAFADPPNAFRAILKNKMEHIRKKGKPLHPDTLRAMEHYLRIEEQEV